MTEITHDLKRRLGLIPERWDWPRVYAAWRDDLSSAGINHDDLFLELNLKSDNTELVGKTYLRWWKNTDIEKRTSALQRSLVVHDKAPKVELYADRHLSKGSAETLQHLYRHRHQPETIAAIFILAELSQLHHEFDFLYVESHSPGADCASRLAQLANKQWQNGELFTQWYTRTRRDHARRLVPSDLWRRNYLRHYRATTDEQCVMFVVAENRVVLRDYRPVAIHIT